MFAYFFAYQNELPENAGFQIYGPEHFLWLGGIVACLILFCLFFSRSALPIRERILNAVVFFALFLTFSQDVILTIIGQMSLHTLPFHLCDLATFVYLIQRAIYLREMYTVQAFDGPDFRSRHKETCFSAVLGEISLTLLMPGAVLGILFPVWTPYPILNFMTIHGFIYHAMVILYPLLLFADGQVQPRFSHIWYPVAFLCCVVPPVLFFDRKFQTNYMYLNHAPEKTPIRYLENRIGNPGYLVGYALLIFLMIIAVYWIFYLIIRKAE